MNAGTLSRSAVLIIVSLLVAAAVPARAADELTLNLELLYLDRGTPNVPLTLEDTVDDGVGDTLVMDTEDAELGWGTGGRISLTKNMGAHTWEWAMMYVGHSGSAETPTPESGIEPYYPYFHPEFSDEQDGTVWVEPFEAAWHHSVSSESDLWGAEVNRIANSGGGPHALVGGRILHLADLVRFSSIDEEPGMGYPLILGDLKVRTSNTLLGVQGGVTGGGKLSGDLHASGTLKVGAYVNQQKKSLSYLYLQDGEAFDDYRSSDRGTRFSYTLEAGGSLDWVLGEATTLSLGYQAIYLANVANAAEQMPLENSDEEFTKRDSGGSVFYHGVRLALAIKF